MRNFVAWGRHVGGLCRCVPQGEGEEFRAMRS